MKAIIDGKRYNTETATKIATGGSGGSCTDFSHYTEALYRTKAGGWFLAGKGGPMSKYATSCDNHNSYTGGCAIIPLSDDEAQDWLESEGDIEALETYFAETLQDA